MDWAGAIETNHSALSRIVAGLIAVMELAKDGRISKLLHHTILRVLVPAESAVRRLIVIAARGLAVKIAPSRPMPKGRVIARNASHPLPFRLIDTRKRFDRRGPRSRPRILSFDAHPLAHLFHQPVPVPPPGDTVDAARLGRRLGALKRALDDLPGQARRMARWQARRNLMKVPRFRSPIRLGPPPGHRKRPREEIDFVLRECHGLAHIVIENNTS